MHRTDVLHSGRLGADEVDGVCEEGADDVEGKVDGDDDGTDDVDGSDVGRTEGAEEGMDEGIDVGYDDVDGSVEGIVAHPAPKMVDSSDPKLPPPSRTTSLS